MYDLVERDDPQEVLSVGNYGNHFPVEGKIDYVRLKQGGETADTIIHEILHALWDKMFVGKGDDEEAIVSKLGTGLTTVMKDNPELFKALQKLVDE